MAGLLDGMEAFGLGESGDCALGEDVREASDAKAAGLVCKGDSCLNA